MMTIMATNNNNSHDDDDGYNNNNNDDDDNDNNNNHNGNNNNNNNHCWWCWWNWGGSKMSGDAELEFIRVFPNPTEGEFAVGVNMEESSSLKVKLYDISGQVLFEDSRQNYEGVYFKQFDLTVHAKGIYLLSINVNGKTTTEKILYNR